MDRNHPLRQQLVELLRGGNAHMSFADAVADFPEDKINLQPPNVDPDEGVYRLSASGGGVAPAPIKVGPRRRSSQNDLLLP